LLRDSITHPITLRTVPIKGGWVVESIDFGKLPANCAG
jgi:hypothetical protein